MIVISLLVIFVGVALYFVFRKDGPMTDGSTPQAFVDSYSEFVRAYVPPSQVLPTKANVNGWLDYFDGPSRDWFEANVDKLSYYRNQAAANDWKSMDRDLRRAHAMKFLLSTGALRGTAVRNIKMDADGNGCTVESASGAMNVTFTMRKSGRFWKIEQMMGHRLEIEERIAKLRLPAP